MSQCLRQLDIVLSLADEEYAALIDEDMGKVEALCEKRSALMAAALQEASGAPRRDLCDRLMRLQTIQQRLYDEAARQRENVRIQLTKTKRETRRMNAYHKTQIISIN